MTTMTRRATLTGLAAASTLGAAGIDPAKAAAPAAGKENGGWYRTKVGDIELTVVTDGVGRFKMGDNHIANVKREEVDAAVTALFLDRDNMITPYNPAVVNTGGKLYVFDPGLGEATLEKSGRAGGQLMANLAAAGIDAKAVDGVIITHMHPDHINGLLKADGSLAFPNAEVLVPVTDSKFWLDDGEMSKASSPLVKMVFQNVRRVFSGEVLKRMRPYEMNKEIAPGVTSVPTPGHTPGHTSHIIASGSRKLFLQGDVTHVPYFFVRNPGWHVFFDQDPQMAEATRRKTYDMLVAEKMMIQGFHFPFPTLVHVEKTSTGYREIPLIWEQKI